MGYTSLAVLELILTATYRIRKRTSHYCEYQRQMSRIRHIQSYKKDVIPLACDISFLITISEINARKRGANRRRPIEFDTQAATVEYNMGKDRIDYNQMLFI